MSVYITNPYKNKYENKKSQFCFLFDNLHEQNIKVISVSGAFLTTVGISLILDKSILELKI